MARSFWSLPGNHHCQPGPALVDAVAQGQQAVTAGGMGPRTALQAWPLLESTSASGASGQNVAEREAGRLVSCEPLAESTSASEVGGQHISEWKTGRCQSPGEDEMGASVSFQEYLGTLDDDKLGQLCENYHTFKSAEASNPWAKIASSKLPVARQKI